MVVKLTGVILMESEEQRARVRELKSELFDLIDEDVGLFLKKHSSFKISFESRIL
ncbi:MAG: hypothetical protein IJ673_05495 [Treponema sp.]|nr:hypothetical protein [Treponema sp.]